MKKYILVIGFIVGMCSCENFLTIRPKSDITEKNLFAEAEGVEDAIYGVYARMAHSNLYAQDMTWGIPDIMAQYFEVNELWDIVHKNAANFVHTNNDLRKKYESMWTAMYQAIGYANNIINALQKKDENSFEYYNTYLGEMIGIRAFLHFDLLRLFAPHIGSKPDEQGIPYVRQWTPLVTPFNTVKEAYAAVTADLQESERLLTKGQEVTKTSDFTAEPQIHFNLYAAQATLARVYWMKGDLDSAAIYARKVIGSEKFRLAEPAEMELLMAQIVSPKEGIFGLATDQLTELYSKAFVNGNEFITDQTLYADGSTYLLYTTDMKGNDYRPSAWFTSTSTHYYFYKLLIRTNVGLTNPFYGNGNIPGITLIRLPEMYLILAEALLEKDPDAARDYFDTFIASRGLTKLKELGVELTIEDIDKERRKEFFGEGQEFYNMKREKRDVRLLFGGTVQGDDEKTYTLLIPDSEFEYRYDVDDKTEKQ